MISGTWRQRHIYAFPLAWFIVDSSGGPQPLNRETRVVTVRTSVCNWDLSILHFRGLESSRRRFDSRGRRSELNHEAPETNLVFPVNTRFEASRREWTRDLSSQGSTLAVVDEPNWQAAHYQWTRQELHLCCCIEGAARITKSCWLSMGAFLITKTTLYLSLTSKTWINATAYYSQPNKSDPNTLFRWSNSFAYLSMMAVARQPESQMNAKRPGGIRQLLFRQNHSQ